MQTRAVDRAGTARAVEQARALSDLALTLSESLSDRHGLELQVVRRAAELVGDASALWRKDDDGHIELVALSHWRDDAREYMEARAGGATHSDTVGVLPHAWQLATPLLLDRTAVREWLPVMQPVYVEYARQFGLVSLMIVPLRAQGVVVGLLGLSRDTDPEHDEGDLDVVERLAAVIATALQNERLQRQLRQHLVAQTRAELAAERAVAQDPLTGLPNRARLVSQLQTLAARDTGGVLVVVLDVDDFRVLNESFGHEAGDDALRELADRLLLLTQQQGGGLRVGRLGSDEFAVIARDVDGGEAELVARLRALAAEPVRVAGRAVQLGLSAGSARGPSHEAEALLRHAQVALSRAKRDASGWAAYARGKDAEAEAHLQAVEALDEGLSVGQVQVAYQPLARRVSGLVLPGDDAPGHLVEALVRWRHPQRGLLEPAAFLPLVLRSGRLDRLTRTVVAQALDDVVEWARIGHDVQVSVNVSAATIGAPDFLPWLQQQLAERGLDSRALCLELVESEVLTPEGPALLDALRRAGFRVAMDDFGTGYSTLAHLADLPLDRLKLDRSFVQRMSQSARMSDFVAGLVGVVHQLGLPVVAEGVEEEAEVLQLDDLGVEYQQGYWHARPQPAVELSVSWSSRSG